MFTRLFYYGTVQLGFSQEEVWLMPFGLLLDLWECHKQFLGLANPKRELCIQEKGTGTIKKLFVDDVDSLEVLLAHSLPEGIANLMIPLAIYVAMFFIDWKLALLSLASIPVSFAAMMIMYSVGMKKMGPYYMAGQKMNNTIIEYINDMEVVKVFNKDAESYERFLKDISDYRDYTLEWYKAAWPWMAVYSSLLLCTIILTLPLGA